MVNRPGYDTAMMEEVRGLETLASIDIKSIPAKNLENIVGLQLAICRDNNIRVRGLYGTINMITRYVKKFIILGKKANDLDIHKERLVKDKYRLLEENSNLKGDVIRLQESLARQKEGVAPLDESEKDEKLKANAAELDFLKIRLKEMFESKERYKNKSIDERRSLDKSMKQIEEEQERAREEIANAEIRVLGAEQESRDKDQAYEKLKREIDRERDERMKQAELNERGNRKITDELKAIKD